MQSILELSQLLRERKVSPVELTSDCLGNIDKLNPSLNAFITLIEDSAMAEARQTENEIQKGKWRGPLHGIPLALKDLIDTAGVPTTAASGVFKNRVPNEDAAIARRLKSAGAIFLGKQNLHEFAYGGSSIVSYFGEVRNAWDPKRIAGGSSGGSATAVAAGLGYGAIGTDTSGSIREPAALCGVVGLKPTFGRVSTRGVIPLSPSLDHVGPIARTVADAAIILQAIAGFDPDDPGSANIDVPNYFASLSMDSAPARIGLPRKFFYEDLAPEVATAVEEALVVFKAMSFDLREVTLSVPTDRTLQSAEAYAYHAEFAARSPELYQQETLRRIMTGANISSSELAEHRRELEQARRDIRGIFEQVDVLITPTVPVPAPTIAELQQDMESLRARELVLLRNTRPFNVWGLPAISVPCGFTQAGLPIGLQIAAPHWAEVRLLQVAHAYEQATGWHEQEP